MSICIKAVSLSLTMKTSTYITEIDTCPVLLGIFIRGNKEGYIAVADPEGAQPAREPPPPVQGVQTKKTTIFRPKFGLECVIWGLRQHISASCGVYKFLQKSAHNPPPPPRLDPPLYRKTFMYNIQ